MRSCQAAQGATTVEYAIMLALITLAVAAFGSGLDLVNEILSRVAVAFALGA